MFRRLIPQGLWPLWAAGLISKLGDSLHGVAIMWLIYELTGSTTATGLIGMSQYLPAVLIGLFAGALVDRLNRKRVMILADAARAILVCTVPILYLLGQLNGLILGLLAFSIAVFTTLFMPARDSIVPQIVHTDELTKAGSLLQGSYGFAFFAGPVAAAALLPWAKLTGLFFADALTYLISLLFLLQLRTKKPTIPTHSVSPIKLVAEGLSYAKSSGLLRGLLLITAVDNLFIMGPAMVGTPLYVRLHLGLGAQSFAAVQAAFALGMIAGSVLVHRIGNRWPRGKVLLWAIIYDGITFVPFYFIDTLIPALLLWFVHSIGVPIILIPRTTLVQSQVPQHLQGRVFSFVNLTVVGLSAVSCALTGIAAEIIPIEALYVIIGISASLVGALGWLFRDFREAV